MDDKHPQYRVIYEVEEIAGTCPVYKVGDRMVFDGLYPTEVLNLKETTAFCRRTSDNLCYHYPFQWGNEELHEYMTGGVGENRIACPMPGPPLTPCGYVLFRRWREPLGEEVK